MAYLVRRSRMRTEIRESRGTARGPRSHVLASFSGPLTPEVLAQAAARATRSFDPSALVRRAHAIGIEVTEHTREREARALLTRLRRSDPLDPALRRALRLALERQPEAAVPSELAEVSEWIGASASERGRALHELLDLYGRIAESRPPPPHLREQPRFPRFTSASPAG